MMEGGQRLVFDLGAHTGQDVRVFLQNGFKVVAVEPHPGAIEKLDALLSGEPNSENLWLVETAITPQGKPAKLYPSSTLNGETHSLYPHRVKAGDGVPITVQGTTLVDLFVEFGVPYYLKIDIEGADVVALRQLHEWATPYKFTFKEAEPYKVEEVPPFLSVELDFDHPEEALEIFSHLGYMGYDGFELIQQFDSQHGHTTYIPDDCLYPLDLPEACRQWCKNLTYRRGFKMPVWYDLHARHSTAPPGESVLFSNTDVKALRNART